MVRTPEKRIRPRRHEIAIIMTAHSKKSANRKSHLSDCLKLVQKAESVHAAKKTGDVLTSEEKRVMPKLPRKAASIVPVLAKLWRQYGADFPTVSIGAMESQFAHATSVREVWAASQLLTKALEDDAFNSECEVWAEATQIYLHLQGIARKDKTLRVALQPITTFFGEAARTERKKKKEKEKEEAEKAAATAAATTASHTVPVVSGSG